MKNTKQTCSKGRHKHQSQKTRFSFRNALIFVFMKALSNITSNLLDEVVDYELV